MKNRMKLVMLGLVLTGIMKIEAAVTTRLQALRGAGKNAWNSVRGSLKRRANIDAMGLDAAGMDARDTNAFNLSVELGNALGKPKMYNIRPNMTNEAAGYLGLAGGTYLAGEAIKDRFDDKDAENQVVQEKAGEMYVMPSAMAEVAKRHRQIARERSAAGIAVPAWQIPTVEGADLAQAQYEAQQTVERDANERMAAAKQDVQDATQILNDALGGLNEAKLTASADMEGYQAAKNEVQLAKQQLIEASLNALSLQNQTPEVIAQTEELNDQWGNLNRDRSDMSWKESLSDDADALVQGLRHIAYNPKMYGKRRAYEARVALKNVYADGSRFVGQKAQEARDVLRDAYESASNYVGNKTQPFKNRLQPWVDYIKSLDYGRLNPMRYMTRQAEAQAAQDDMNEIVEGANYEMPMNYDVPAESVEVVAQPEVVVPVIEEVVETAAGNE